MQKSVDFLRSVKVIDKALLGVLHLCYYSYAAMLLILVGIVIYYHIKEQKETPIDSYKCRSFVAWPPNQDAYGIWTTDAPGMKYFFEIFKDDYIVRGYVGNDGTAIFLNAVKNPYRRK